LLARRYHRRAIFYPAGLYLLLWIPTVDFGGLVGYNESENEWGGLTVVARF